LRQDSLKGKTAAPPRAGMSLSRNGGPCPARRITAAAGR
jgi:hypothetical protein